MKKVIQPLPVFVFEGGGVFTAELLANPASNTVAYVLEILPLEVTVITRVGVGARCISR